MIDRIVGAAIFMIAASAFWIARDYEAAFGDPLGPAAFPCAVAVVMAVLSLGLIFRPDPNPEVQSATALMHQAATLAVLIGYVLALEPLGFPLSTALATSGLSLLFGARLWKAAVTGVVAGLALFTIFDRLLGLPLPFAPSFFS